VETSESIHYREPQFSPTRMADSGNNEPNPLSQKEHMLSDFLTHNQIYTAGFISCLA
jgi:hypothetical protein